MREVALFAFVVMLFFGLIFCLQNAADVFRIDIARCDPRTPPPLGVAVAGWDATQPVGASSDVGFIELDPRSAASGAGAGAIDVVEQVWTDVENIPSHQPEQQFSGPAEEKCPIPPI